MLQEKNDAVTTLANIMPFISAYLRNAVADQVGAIARLAGDEDTDSPEMDKQIAYQGTYRLMRLMGNLTAAEVLASDRPFLRRNQDLVAWLDQVCRKAEGLYATKNVSLTFQTDLSYKIVAYNDEKLEIALYQLLSNALKFTPEGGAVTVTLRQAPGRMLIAVADNGCGISEEMRPIVFERFLHYERIDGPDHGLGLGLPISRQIALRHGGALLLDSREGAGTTVTLSLPDKRLRVDEVECFRCDYLGGFSHAHVNLSDGLELEAFTTAMLDH